MEPAYWFTNVPDKELFVCRCGLVNLSVFVAKKRLIFQNLPCNLWSFWCFLKKKYFIYLSRKTAMVKLCLSHVNRSGLRKNERCDDVTRRPNLQEICGYFWKYRKLLGKLWRSFDSGSVSVIVKFWRTEFHRLRWSSTARRSLDTHFERSAWTCVASE